MIALKKIPTESVDLVVTDCPYRIVGGGNTTNKYKVKQPSEIFNRSYDYKITNSNKVQKYQEGTSHAVLGGILNDNEYATYARQGKLFKHNDIKFSDWLPEIYRVLKKDTHCYIYISARNLKELQIEAENVGFKFQQLIVWQKNNVTPNKFYLNNYELILMLRKGKAKFINNMGTKNLIKIDNIRNKTHPTEKPIELNKILIENSSNEGNLILDPFMGTGSCGVACKQINRNFIGIEIDEKYFKIAQNRIKNINNN